MKSSNHSMQSGSSISTSARAQMEMRIAEVNLETAMRKKELVAKALNSEHAVIQAQSALARAKSRSEASQGIFDLEDEEPPLSSFDKVSQYVEGLPVSQPDGNLEPTQESRCSRPYALDSKTTISQQTLKVQASPWITTPVLPDYTMQAVYGDVLLSQAPEPSPPVLHHSVSHGLAGLVGGSQQTIYSGLRVTGPEATFSLPNYSHRQALSMNNASNLYDVFGF